MLGTKELNKSLQEVLNPKATYKEEKKRGGATFRVGDRVMQMKNNYDIYWEKEILDENGNEAKEAGSGIFNGEIGTIENIDSQDKTVQVHFDDDKKAWYEPSELEQLEHSYAITIHKAQGSEFDVVLMVVPQASPMLLTRNLIYTGITRAKKLLIIIGADRVIGNMIKNTDTKKRNTGLKYKIQELNQ